MRVVVAGSRTFDNYDMMVGFLDAILVGEADVTIVSGGAGGADRLGERYAKERGHGLKLCLADWKRYGKSAGPMRNTKMARNADMVVCFWDGESRGTKHMIATAESYGLRVYVVKYGA